MRAQGWDKRPGVKILFGRWQDLLPQQEQQFDGIFFDTYSEYYGDMQYAPTSCRVSWICKGLPFSGLQLE